MTDQTLDTTSDDTPINTAPTSGLRDSLGTVADVDEGKREVLVDIPWEVIDTFKSDFERSCFDEYLGQRLPVMCWAHNKQEPIGRARSWQKGARANQFVARFSDLDAVPRARQAFTQIRDGDITDFSFYFDQATAVAHPSERGAIRFTKARMPEISPVIVGSIPGAVVTGVRAAADATGVAELVRSQVISEEEGRAMLGLSGDVPVIGERQPVREEIRIGAGARSITITVGDDGTVSTSGDTTPPDTAPAGDGGTDPADALSAVDGAIDAALAYLEQVDLSALPSAVGMAFQLLQAADVACDELMEATGTPDYDTDATRAADGQGDAPDGGAEGERSVEYADPGYQDDKQKRYPIDTEAHVRAALSYIGQADNAGKYSAEDLAKVKGKIEAAARKFGIDVAGDSKRAAEDLDTDTQVALARMTLGRH